MAVETLNAETCSAIIINCARYQLLDHRGSADSYGDPHYVLHGLDMPHCNTVMAGEFHSSYGAIVL